MFKNKFVYIYISIILIFSLFFVTQQQISGAYLGIKVDLYFISKYSKDIIIVAIVSFTLLITFIFNKNRNTDKIVLLLFFRLALSLIPLLYTEPDHFWGIYFIQIADLLIYLTARNTSLKYVSEKTIINILIIASIIISIQVITAGINVTKVVSYLNISYKYLMTIPYGFSNYIATFILPIFIAFMYSNNGENKKKWLRIIILLLLMIGIISTKSRSGIIIMLIATIYKIIWIDTKNIRNKNLSVLFLYTNVIIIIFIISISLAIYKDNILIFLSGFSSVATGDFADRITSNRLSLYVDYFKMILDSPIWGHGPAYFNEQKRSHNLIIDIMYQSGVIGLTIYILIIKTWFNKIKNYRNNYFISFSLILCLTIIINSMVEISLFTAITTDFLFFTMMGLSSSKVDLVKNNENLLKNSL